MRSYQQALKHYNDRPQPPRAKYWTQGEGKVDNGRPLRRTAEDHMGIYKTDAGVIYYKLYETRVATLYPPEADGTERVVFKYVGTQTTGSFMQNFSLHMWEVQMDDGTKARIPYVENGKWRDNSMVTADLVFNKEGQVIRSRSWHKDVYTMVSSAEDKAKRKELRAKVEHLITLAMFKLPNLKENVKTEEHLGRPFGTGYGNAPRNKDMLIRHVNNNGVDINDNTFIDLFMDSLQDAFNAYASKVCYEAGLFHWGNFWGISDSTARDKAMQEFRADQQVQRLLLTDTIDEVGFKKSLTNMLLTASNTKTGTIKKPWGQFMPTIPANYIT